jgi:tetratricopeptide (TPR) repeat protein
VSLSFVVVLASVCKSRGDFERAFEYAARAVALADRVQDPRLISRSHNNLGIYCLEQSEVERAFSLFTSAYRATQQTMDFQQQATVKYHLGLALAYLGRNLNGKQDIGEEDEEEDTSEEAKVDTGSPEAGETTESDADALSLPNADTASTGSELPTPTITVVEPPTKAPKDLFLESENLTGALPEPDHALRVLAQSCRGEEEYYAGEFHTAEAEFAIALGQLRELTGVDLEEQQSSEAPDADVTEDEVTLPPIETELAKLHGLLLSYTGCTQLVEGKFTLAEQSHKRDLALALRQEDLHAQHRALRNLAIMYNATQRYVEAIPLWREALELAVVLDFKGEQLMAYSGLGSALRELLMLEGPGAIVAAGVSSGSGPMQPLQIFTKQRALAEQVGDLHQQILAQRHIVSVYESPISKPQTEGEALEALERRLSECDALVQLCEKYENLQYRADAYRSLANALTSQLARLRARANGDGTSAPHYGLADAIAVLSEKRNSVCVSYQEANVALSTAAALMFQDVYEEGLDDEAQASKPKPDERHARPPLTRLEILQRR